MLPRQHIKLNRVKYGKFENTVHRRSTNCSSTNIHERSVTKLSNATISQVSLLERVRNKSTEKKNRIQLGFKPKTFWILVRCSRTPGRGVEDKLHIHHCLEASAEFQLILTLSDLDFFFPWIYFSLSLSKNISIHERLLSLITSNSEFTWGCLGNRLYNSYTAPCGVLILHISVWQTTICEICDMYHYVKWSLPREGLAITWITQACINKFVFLWKLIWTGSAT